MHCVREQSKGRPEWTCRERLQAQTIAAKIVQQLQQMRCVLLFVGKEWSGSRR
jgi:hypothetical protein